MVKCEKIGTLKYDASNTIGNLSRQFYSGKAIPIDTCLLTKRMTRHFVQYFRKSHNPETETSVQGTSLDISSFSCYYVSNTHCQLCSCF